MRWMKFCTFTIEPHYYQALGNFNLSTGAAGGGTGGRPQVLENGIFLKKNPPEAEKNLEPLFPGVKKI